MCPETVDRLERIEAKLDQVISLLAEEGAEDEEAEHSVEVVTLDGYRHRVASSASEDMSAPRGVGSKSGRPDS